MAKARSRRTTPLTREVIVDTAREMLADEDVDSLSLRRLAARLDVTAPALYAHVRDKSDLLTALAEQGFDELEQSFEKVEVDDPVERLVAFGKAYVERAVTDPGMFKVMFVFRPDAVPMAGIDNELAAATASMDRPLRGIADAMASGAIDSDRDPLLCALTLWTAAHGAASVLLLGQHGGAVVVPDNADDLVDNVMRTVLVGLSHPAT